MTSPHCAARDCFNGKTLLVIDQDYFLVDDVKRMVENWGGSFLVFDTVGDAQDYLKSGRADAAIVDIEIETRDAFLLCERLDELSIPFVFAFGDSAAEAVRAHGGFALRGSIEALTDIGHGLFSRYNVSPYN
jgi:CheY-like chemotaxis protein